MDVTLVEVGPRDGLQNEPRPVPTTTKIELINRLSDCGLRRIEVSSFVSANKIPQLTDADDIFAALKRTPNCQYSALIPNEQGLARALSCQVDAFAVFTSASNTFNQKNIHCTIEESYARMQPIAQHAKQHNIPLRGYVSCIVHCPYEGPILPSAVVPVCEKLLALGCNEISLGDTTGVATPKQIIALLDALKHIPAKQLALHCHNTYGQAVANVYAALEHHLRTFDASIAGLGGCPYAKGASGNVATEELVYLFEGLGLNTGVDLTRLCETSHWISQQLSRASASQVTRARMGA
jgi:hydroxymethylglutaryl-CoA lyase